MKAEEFIKINGLNQAKIILAIANKASPQISLFDDNNVEYQISTTDLKSLIESFELLERIDPSFQTIKTFYQTHKSLKYIDINNEIILMDRLKQAIADVEKWMVFQKAC